MGCEQARILQDYHNCIEEDHLYWNSLDAKERGLPRENFCEELTQLCKELSPTMVCPLNI